MAKQEPIPNRNFLRRIGAVVLAYEQNELGNDGGIATATGSKWQPPIRPFPGFFAVQDVHDEYLTCVECDGAGTKILNAAIPGAFDTTEGAPSFQDGETITQTGTSATALVSRSQSSGTHLIIKSLAAFPAANNSGAWTGGTSGAVFTPSDEPDFDTVNIAKPWDLRSSTWDGLTRAGIDYEVTGVQQRTADDGSTTQDEEITPSYLEYNATEELLGSVIVAEVMGSGTGVLVSGDELYLKDVNDAGRAWAKVVEA